MTAEPTETQPEEGRRAVAPPPAEEEGKPLFDLGELLRSRRGKGEGLGVAEAILLMDYQDRKDDRLWRRQQAESAPKNPPSHTSSPEFEGLKNQVAELAKTVNTLTETIQSERQKEAQKEFVDGVVKQTADKIMPELQAVKQKLEEYDKKLAGGEAPSTNLEDIKDALVDAIDKIGEKVGAGGKTLSDVVSDVDKIMTLFDTIEKRTRRPGEGGEVDYKTMAVSTVGEIGKELISAYRDIATTSPGGGFETPKEETPASTMQTVIKRQVQNYLTQRMTAGAVTFNVAEAAKDLGLTPGQIVWAYKTLMKEGFFHVKIPSKTKKKVNLSEIIGEGEGEVINPPEAEAETTTPPQSQEEQVFPGTET